LKLDHVIDVSNENDDYHYLIEKCIKETDRLYWYHQELLKLYAEHGTYRAVSEITNIPVKSIHNAIKKAKVKLKKEIWK
jgi:DNA-directed RNA polymerase specialized sigma24 family protein